MPGVLQSDAVPVITVDGPSGTGKGTVCHGLAHHLNWHFLDSGALYRVLAMSASQRGVDLADVTRLVELARTLDLEFRLGASLPFEHTVWCAGHDCTAAIRTEACARGASVIAVLPEVRQALLSRQQAFRKRPGLVADGRDMGTVVFPNADLKIYLTASAEERGLRRFQQLKQQGIDVTLPRLIKDIAERDARDTARSTAPLRPAPDAVILDTSKLSKEAVFERVMELVRARRLLQSP
jgi:cytidylate kinase